MPTPHYPPGAVRALVGTDLMTPQTRDVMRSRLGGEAERAPRYLGAGEFATLRAVCDRLIPQGDRERPVDLAGALDDRLAGGKSDGWRYDAMPPDGEAYGRGLRGLDESSRAMFGERLVDLDGRRQDEVLRAVQDGTAPGEAWATLPPRRFFEELLVELSECYYSDPLSQEEIGYVGMADAKGWGRIGLGQLEPHEPRALEVEGE